MDGFGFPASAGEFRFRAEAEIVRRLLGDIEYSGSVLDLGSGVGYWAEEFACSFSQVDAVEGSNALYPSLLARCAPSSNIRTIHSDVQSFTIDAHYNLVFLGGLLMYLNDDDVITLLKRVVPCLGSKGVVLCRESTVPGERVTCTGDYPVIYRAVSDYQRIFAHCGLTLKHVERNEPYVLLQMGCELVKKWKQVVPKPLQALPVVGRLIYWSMRLGAGWMTYLPRKLGLSFPRLQNHFFVLGAESNLHESIASTT